MIKVATVVFRTLIVILIGFVSAVIGFVAGVIIGGTLAGLYEIVFGSAFVFLGREGYEATGPLGFILGALIGLVASGVYLFGKRPKKLPLKSS